jgi:phosphoserine aminotransferase
MSTTTTRVYNFSPGPAVLPLPVLEEAQRDLVALPGVGMSVLEISHRGKVFEGILAECEANIRKLATIPATYKILFLQGGASTQFSMVPMNLLGPGKWADHIVNGAWGEKAIKEAKKVGAVNLAHTTGPDFKRVSKAEELKLTPGAAYVHMTSNETIQGVAYTSFFDTGSVPLVCDTSSDMFSGPIDVTKFGLVYAGAQKNMGPAGVALIIIREDLIGKAPKTVPSMMDYAVLAKEPSLYNTPPCFGIYIVGLVMKWLVGLGGLEAIKKINDRKASKIYAQMDSSGFYRGHAEKDSRSIMNLTFRLPSEELEEKFAKEAKAAGLDGLKGHRSVGGMRASIYNAFPEDGVDALVSFMKEFEKKNG